MNDRLLKLQVKIQTILMREEGQDLIEYALVVSLIAFAAVATMKTLATDINNAYIDIGTPSPPLRLGPGRHPRHLSLPGEPAIPGSSPSPRQTGTRNEMERTCKCSSNFGRSTPGCSA